MQLGFQFGCRDYCSFIPRPPPIFTGLLFASTTTNFYHTSASIVVNENGRGNLGVMYCISKYLKPVWPQLKRCIHTCSSYKQTSYMLWGTICRGHAGPASCHMQLPLLSKWTSLSLQFVCNHSDQSMKLINFGRIVACEQSNFTHFLLHCILYL